MRKPTAGPTPTAKWKNANSLAGKSESYSKTTKPHSRTRRNWNGPGCWKGHHPTSGSKPRTSKCTSIASSRAYRPKKNQGKGRSQASRCVSRWKPTRQVRSAVPLKPAEELRRQRRSTNALPLAGGLTFSGGAGGELACSNAGKGITTGSLKTLGAERTREKSKPSTDDHNDVASRNEQVATGFVN